MKKWKIGIMMLCTLWLVGCSNQSTDKGEKLIVGTEGTYPPFTYHDEKGTLTGYDVEMIQEIGKRMKVDVEFMETQWDAIFAGLDSKRFDVIANQVGINEIRKEKYLFSKPYIKSSAAIVVRKDDSTIKAIEDLKGKKVAQSLTSNYADIAKAAGAEIVGVEGLSQAVELLSSKRVDATINDKLSALHYMNIKKDASIKLILLDQDQSESGFMLRKDSEELLKKVNKALDEMEKDGTAKSIYEKYFGDVSE